MSALIKALNICMTIFWLSFISLPITSSSPVENIGEIWKEDDEFVHVYSIFPNVWFTLEPPTNWKDENSTTPMAVWTIVLTGIFIIAITLFCCFLLCKLSGNFPGSRHYSTDALVAHAPPVPAARIDRDRTHRLPFNGHRYNGQYLSDFASTENRLARNVNQNDGPPEYTAAVENVPSDRETRSQPTFPRVHQQKKVETPPPAYITVAPFK